jgi:hypothetical protein
MTHLKVSEGSLDVLLRENTLTKIKDAELVALVVLVVEAAVAPEDIKAAVVKVHRMPIARGWGVIQTLNGAPLLCFEVVEVQVVDTVTVLHPSKHVDPLWADGSRCERGYQGHQ